MGVSCAPLVYGSEFGSVGQRGLTSSGLGGFASARTPSPWDDMASRYMPDSHRSVLSLCEFIWNQQETYRTAVNRVISYFITELKIGGQLGEQEKKQWLRYTGEEIELLNCAYALLQDRACYGNGFFSWLIPFKRFLLCPKCGLQLSYSEARRDTTYRFTSDLQFQLTCPKCHYHGDWQIRDEKDITANRIYPKIWPVYEIEIAHDPLTDTKRFAWRIPEYYKQQVRRGDFAVLETADKDVLAAIRNNHLFVFKPDQIYHAYEPVVSGLRTRGWGISKTLLLFRQIWYVQVLRRSTEAVATDFVIPWRVITPAPRNGPPEFGDPVASGDMSVTVQPHLRRMLRKRMQDPLAVHVLPFPVQYQALGAEASQLAPAELLNQGMDTLLNGAGVPAEMYRGTMQMQVIPVAIRGFESLHRPLVWELNRFLRWSMARLGEALGWEVGDISMASPTYLDDMNKQMALIQLMAGQTISRTTALRSLGLEFDDENKLKQEELRAEQEVAARMQEEMAQDAFAQQIAKGQDPNAPPPGATMPGAGGAPGAPAPPGGAPAGGDPTAAGGDPMTQVNQLIAQVPQPGQPISMEDVQGLAQQLASALLGLPESIKDSTLRQLKQQNDVVHAATRSAMDKQRQSMDLQGREMLRSGGGAM